jgi:anti-sigma-K factor RskA
MMDNQEHVIELLPAFALDILDEADISQVSLHLAECESCLAEFENYQEMSEQLSLAVAGVEPPEGVKARLLEAIDHHPGTPEKPKNVSWQEKLSNLSHAAIRAWAVVSLVLVAALLFSNILLWQQISQPDMTDSLRVVALSGEEYAPHARGMLTMSINGEEGTLVVDGLAHIEQEFEYQLWLYREDEASSGGTFMVYRNGYGYMRVESEEPLLNYERFMVSIELEGGSQSPTGPVVLAGDL